MISLQYCLFGLNTKFRRIGVPTRDSFSRRILKASNLGRVEARYLKPKIVFSRSTNTSPVRNRSNTIVHTQILIHVMTIFSCKSQILKFWFKYYLSRVITHDSAQYSYPSNSRLLSFFRVAKRGWVIRRNLISCLFSYNFNQQKLLHTKRK